MKKILSAVAVFMLAVSAPASAKAAGAISTGEQKVLTELNKGASINGRKLKFAAKEITAVENYLKRVDLTDSQVSEALKNIQSARSLFESQTVNLSGAETLGQVIRSLPSNVIQQIADYVIAAGKAVGITVIIQNGQYITMTDKDGSIIYQSGSVVKTTGVDAAASILLVGALLSVSIAGAVVYQKRKGSAGQLIAE